MQGAEDEVEGSVLTYVTETEFRKQRSRSPSCNSLHVRKHTPFAPLSAPCIWGILQSPYRKSGAFSAKDHFAKVFSIGTPVSGMPWKGTSARRHPTGVLCWIASREIGRGCDTPCGYRYAESRQVCSGRPTCPPRPTRQRARLDAPRQGCSVFSPGVEEGRKPRRRPRDGSVGRNPLDPARASH